MSTTTQNLGKVGLVDHGVYSQTKEYNRLDFVTDENNISTYLSLADKNVGNPLTDTTKWRFLAKGVANTPQEALDLILQADGPESGLDADTLDGTQLEEIVNPEELASASPFDYFLGAKEVDGKWVFKKMAPTEVATVVAGKIGAATTSSIGLMEPSQKYTLKGISGTEGKNYGRISCASRDAALLTVRVGGLSTSSLYYVGKGMNGIPFVNHITGSAPSDISFYYDESYIYYNRKFGGHDSLSPVSATTGMDLDSVSVIPSEATPINVGSTNVFGYNTIEDLSTGVAGLIGINDTWFKNNGKNLGNANNLKAGITSCYYGDSAASLNYPYGYCIVITFYGAEDVRIQFAANESATSPHLSCRAKWDNWSAWKQIY